MARRAKLAALLKRGKRVLAGSHVIQRPGEELMPVERSPEFVGKHPGSFGKRQAFGRIQNDVPDFVAEVAVDAFRIDSV
jgi:hypothetical protein